MILVAKFVIWPKSEQIALHLYELVLSNYHLLYQKLHYSSNGTCFETKNITLGDLLIRLLKIFLFSAVERSQNEQLANMVYERIESNYL
jgi:hypothetical protein